MPTLDRPITQIQFPPEQSPVPDVIPHEDDPVDRPPQQQPDAPPQPDPNVPDSPAFLPPELDPAAPAENPG